MVTVTGALTPVTAPSLLTEGVALIDTGRRNLVLDLTEVPSCDSTGTGVFQDLHHLAGNVSGKVVLTAIRGPVQRQLERAGLIGLVPTTMTPGDALRAVGAEPDTTDGRAHPAAG